MEGKFLLTIQIAGDTGFENYVSALTLCGARSVLSLSPGDESDCAGLLLPGGGDVDPSFYHQENCGSRDIDRSLDRSQFALLEQYRNSGKPVLGICRGHQMINVFFGGNLTQDLPTADHHQRKMGKDVIHSNAAEPGSFLTPLYGHEFTTNSAHHQGIHGLGKNLMAVQYADDGVIEAIRHEILPIFGVQWHPERIMGKFSNPDTVDGSILFRSFLSLVARYGSNR